MNWPMALAALLIVAPSPIHATGNEPQSHDTFVAASLYAACTHSVKDANTAKDHEYLEESCTTYLRGLTDGLWIMQSLANDKTRTCLPVEEPIGVQEARVTFETWLQGHPGAARNSAGLVAAMSLIYAHKCSGPN
jgi:hypothetical protein